MAPSMSKQAVKVSPITGALGAVVDGVDLHGSLDDDTAQLLRDALHEHSVLFFHDQVLTEDEQLAFASQFGTVGQYPVQKLFGGTALTSTIEDTADSPPDADGWHTDFTWVAEPPAYAFLNAQVIPERGGDTMWASLFAAYDVDGRVLGEVTALTSGAQDLLTVRTPDGRDALVPFVTALVPEVDVAGGRIVVADRPGLVSPFAEDGDES